MITFEINVIPKSESGKLDSFLHPSQIVGHLVVTKRSPRSPIFRRGRRIHPPPHLPLLVLPPLRVHGQTEEVPAIVTRTGLDGIDRI